MVSIPRFLIAPVAACLFANTPALAQPAPDTGDQAATGLWRSFLDEYQKFSQNPLAPEVLDERARAALIASAGPRFRAWKPDYRPSFPELVDEMTAQDGSVRKFDRIEETLHVLLPQIDQYGSYKTASDVSQLKEALRQNPGGVHLTLDESPDGRILCYPLEDGPAALAGVKPGAVLLAVDDLPSDGKSLSALRLACVGPPGAPIRLKLRQPHGKIEEFNIVRTDKPTPNITLVQTPLGLTLRIRKFDKGTAKIVKSLLEPHPQPGRLTLDLRGNPGGVRNEAFLVASLFFPQGTELAKFTGKAGTEIAHDGNGVAVEPTSISILQDQRTASAAEYLIAALKEGLPEKTSLFGTRTYGKCHSTVHTSLAGGGELAVTEALLATASGKSWDKTGIVPDKAE